MPSENNIAMGIKKNTLGLVKKHLCSIMAYVSVDHNGLNGILKKKNDNILKPTKVRYRIYLGLYNSVCIRLHSRIERLNEINMFEYKNVFSIQALIKNRPHIATVM